MDGFAVRRCQGRVAPDMFSRSSSRSRRTAATPRIPIPATDRSFPCRPLSPARRRVGGVRAYRL